ncbi:unnamed protein product [Vitrella brassicaformis CCMP3155]|uniref:Uncharacterized protein n=1 Tax=Vitrella brassicaformis (strain CCMP3155) TaxID=1169540 RepID=A0A0G4H1P0_VITBC|nr:unnamed protein product [Vitrella brassicaformis CCMP3155]|eukprot:CEM37419.1 unnamed protein product [Vitrella brassicaformis CCMP3155]
MKRSIGQSTLCGALPALAVVAIFLSVCVCEGRLVGGGSVKAAAVVRAPVAAHSRSPAFMFPETELIKVFGRLAEHDYPEGEYAAPQKRPDYVEPWALVIRPPVSPGVQRAPWDNPAEAFAWDSLFPRGEPALNKRNFAQRLRKLQFRWPLKQGSAKPEGEPEALALFNEVTRQLQYSDKAADLLELRSLIDYRLNFDEMDQNALNVVFNALSGGRYQVTLEDFEKRLAEWAKESKHTYIDYDTFRQRVIGGGQLVPWAWTTEK